jgi:hypothetical protein
MIHIIPAPCTR